MDVSALKQQSPFAPAAESATPANASDEFLAVFRKHVIGGARTSNGGLADPSKALFAIEREMPEPVQPAPERPEAKSAAPAPERPRDRQKPTEKQNQEADATPSQEAAEAPQKPAPKPQRAEQKGKKGESDAEVSAAPNASDDAPAETVVAPVLASMLPVELANQVKTDLAPVIAQAAANGPVLAPSIEGDAEGDAGKPLQQAPVFAATAAPKANKQKIELETGNENWLEQPIQVTSGEAPRAASAEPKAASNALQNMIVAMTAEQNAGAPDGGFTPDFSTLPEAVPQGAINSAAPSAQAAAAELALTAQLENDAAARNVFSPVLANAAADAATATGAGKTAIEGSNQIGATGSTQGTADASKAKAPAAPPPARPVPPKELVPEIKAQVIKALADGVERINIQMRPAQLGKIEIRLEIGQDGQLTASFTAENKDTLQMLQRDARDLHKGFQEAGLQTDSNSLTFNLRGGQGEQQAGDGQRRSGQRGLPGQEVPADDKTTPENFSSRTSGVDISV
jgi:flagellar hook-length control protein FliK